MRKHYCGYFDEVFSLYSFDYLIADKRHSTALIFDFRICVIGIDEKVLEISNVFASRFKTITLTITLDKLSGQKKEVVSYEKWKKRNQKRNKLPEISIENVKDSNFYLVTIPHFDSDDLVSLYLDKVSQVIGETIGSGDIILFEYSVDLTDCINKIEEISGFKRDVNFFLAFRPKLNKIEKNKATISTESDLPEVAKIVDGVYKTVANSKAVK